MATVLAFVAAAAVSQKLNALNLKPLGNGECSATLPSFPDSYYYKFSSKINNRVKMQARMCCPRFAFWGTHWWQSCYKSAPGEQLDVCAVADEYHQCCGKEHFSLRDSFRNPFGTATCVHFYDIENQEALCNQIDGAQWCGNPEKSASPQLTGAQTGSIASGAVLGGVFVATSIAVAQSKP